MFCLENSFKEIRGMGWGGSRSLPSPSWAGGLPVPAFGHPSLLDLKGIAAEKPIFRG